MDITAKSSDKQPELVLLDTLQRQYILRLNPERSIE